MKVRVIGAGVSGLTSALRICEAGHEVEVLARELPLQTTSAVAAAVWYPYRALPFARVLEWSRRSYEVFTALKGTPGAGVVLHQAVEVFRAPAALPWWKDAVQGFRRARADELPPGYVDGFVFNAPVVEMPLFLPWLEQRLTSLGVRLRVEEVRALSDATQGVDAVVNCSGLGARSLTGDRDLVPVRGEVLSVSLPRDARLAFDEDERAGMAYVIPRSADCVLGGTAVEGSASLEPDEAEARGILQRCSALVPSVANARVRGHRVGLRPGRSAVRLERELVAGLPVIHNYGHGGAGVTLSWGCAEEVVALLGHGA